MKIKKRLITFLLLSLAALSIVWISRQTPPILTKPLSLAGLGEFSLTEPLWGSRKLIVAFLDTSLYSPADISHRLATGGMTPTSISLTEVEILPSG